MPGSTKPADQSSLEFEKVSLTDARKVLEEEGPAGYTVRRKTENWVEKRHASGPETLGNEATAWMAELPEAVRPKQLGLRYARLANRLAQLWKSQQRCERLLDELMIDKRGGRQGFPLAVANEIATLREHYFKLHHKGSSAWEHVEMGR